jgi:hypothetical protein
MMCAITHPGNRLPTTHVMTYVDDMIEFFANTEIGKVIPILTKILEYKMQRAEAQGLSLLQITQTSYTYQWLQDGKHISLRN